MEKRTKITIGLFIAFVFFTILHNAMYGLFGTEEAVFFTLALLSALGFVISLVYSIIMFAVEKGKHKKKSKKDKITFMYMFAISIMVLGMLFNIFKLGRGAFSAFGSVGNWLIYIGFIGLIYATIRLIWQPKKRIIDERMEFVATKALRISFLVLVIFAFLIMIIDGIYRITMPYHLFMSYLVAGILAVYYIGYKILLKQY